MTTPTSPVVAALFVSRKGPYWTNPDCDCWDEERDARKYAGPLPVVAHPPCTVWSNMSAVVEARRGIAQCRDDRFDAALEFVQEFGGVLEQPAFSKAWQHNGMPKPGIGWSIHAPTVAGDVWVCQVSQSAYGHRARKWTWLYYVGRNIPDEMDLSSPKGTHVVSYCRRRGDGTIWNDSRPRLTKLQASLTPPLFASALVALARKSGSK